MILKNRINIGVYGQDIDVSTGARTTRLSYSYSTRSNASLQDNDDWVKAFFDPRDARAFNTSELFAVWFDNQSIFYGIVFPSNDAGDGRKVLAINVKGLISQDGDIVISTLRNLRDLYLIGENNLKSDVVDNLLLSFDISLVNSNNYIKPVSSNLKGYRCFSTESELAKLFTYPHQNDYKEFKCVFFSPNDLKQPNPNLKLISAPIHVMYQIGYIPDGVVLEPSRHVIAEGGTLMIIYKKDGFKDEPHKVAITGHNDPFVTYRNSVIDISDAKTAGIRFMRKVVLDFVESDTKRHVSKVSIREKGQQQQQIDTILYVPEDILSVYFTATCTGYQTKEVHLGMADIVSGRVQIELEPKKKERTITIVLPDGRQSSIKAVVKDTDPLSTYLHNNGGYIEVKNRSYSRKNTSDGDNGSDKSIWERIPNWVFYSAIAAITGLMIFCVWKYWPFSEDNDEEKDNSKIEQVDSQQAESQAQDFNEADFNADLDYLKQHEQWNKLDLKTDDFKNLIDYISNGQVSQAVAHPYKNNDKVNGHWNGILSIIEQHKNDSQFMSKVADEMRKCCKNETANIEKLHSALELLLQKNDNHTEREMTNPSPTQTHQTTNRSATTNTNVTNSSSTTNSSNSVNNNTARTRGGE